jgi:YidC/Oxa1 family membrane protein insertase
MEIWDQWLAFISSSIEFISMNIGVTEALAIIVFTMLTRIALMPVSIISAYKMHKNKLKIEKIKPELKRIKKVYKDNQQELNKKTLALYKKNKVKFLDRITVVNMGSQGILGIGVFQALREMEIGSKFMWINDISKPDAFLAFVVGVLTFLSMQMMPGVAEQHSILLYVIPAIISMVVLLGLPSTLGIYWLASNLITMVQNKILKFILIKEGTLAKNS